MPWIAVELTLDASAASAVAEALLEAGAISVDLTDAQAGTDLERPIFNEPATDAAAAWDLNRLRALFPEQSDIVAALEQARRKAQLTSLPPHRILLVEEQDWVRLTQRQFEPIRISDRLWIVPSWHAAPAPHAINIVLDPGGAFGTGSHATTRLCLQWLDQNLRPGNSVIDYGCGSGILAIAAAKLGANRVTGVDIDPQALAASRYNA
ncbi:MAG: 50S ribosomal protein L11 methyltransferase, partial [Burkholderiales bacterium]